jgi:hypothetical protein
MEKLNLSEISEITVKYKNKTRQPQIFRGGGISKFYRLLYNDIKHTEKIEIIDFDDTPPQIENFQFQKVVSPKIKPSQKLQKHSSSGSSRSGSSPLRGEGLRTSNKQRINTHHSNENDDSWEYIQPPATRVVGQQHPNFFDSSEITRIPFDNQQTFIIQDQTKKNGNISNGKKTINNDFYPNSNKQQSFSSNNFDTSVNPNSRDMDLDEGCEDGICKIRRPNESNNESEVESNLLYNNSNSSYAMKGFNYKPIQGNPLDIAKEMKKASGIKFES